MKRALIEGAVLAALVLALEACERDAFSSSQGRTREHDGGVASSQALNAQEGGTASPQVNAHDGMAPKVLGSRDDGGREIAPVAPRQVTGGSGGTGGTFGSGGAGGSGGGITGGSGGTGGIRGQSTGGAAGMSGSY